MKTYLFVMLMMLLLCVVLLLVRMQLNRRSRRQIGSVLEENRLQNKHMENTIDICSKALELTKEVRSDILSACETGSGGAGSEIIRKCDELLYSTNGEDTALGVLLSEKKGLCREKGIEFRDEAVFFPDSRQIEEVDAVSLIGNLLDNAIEAASFHSVDEGRRYVQLVSQSRKNVWIVKVINAKDPKTVIDGKNMTTKKADAENHGLGTGIVRMIVSRYSGDIRTEDRKDVFQVSIRMIMKKIKVS